MILTDKKYRKELERQLAAWFSQSSLNGFIEIAVGEACSDYHLAVANGEVVTSPKGWIYKNAKNKILNELERLGHHYRITDTNKHDSVLPSDTTFEDAENARIMLEEILPLIDEKKREALLIHTYQGYTLEETAQKLNISVSMVEKLIRQAKSELRKAVKKNK